MKEILGPVGLGVLVCLPCLLIGGGALIVTSGGALAALANNPLLQLLGLTVLGGGALLAVRALRARREGCEECEALGASHAEHLRLAASRPRREP